MALVTTAIFTLEQLQGHLKITGALDAATQAALELIGNGASQYCEERTSRIFKQRTISELRNGDDSDRLLLLQRPMISVASVMIDDVELDTTDYVVFTTKGKLQLKTRTFPAGVGNVAITYDAGYADPKTECPQVYAAALDLAKSAYDEWSVGAISLSSISMGPASTVIRPGLNPRIEKYLDSIADVRG